MPKRILFIVVSIAAAEILIIRWNAHSGEHLKLRSFVIAVISGVFGALLTELWVTLSVSRVWRFQNMGDSEHGFGAAS